MDPFLADRLPSALEQEVAQHLDSCDACRQRIERLASGEPLRSAKSQDSGYANVLVETRGFDEELRCDVHELTDFEVEPQPSPQEQAAELLRLLAAQPTDDVAGVRLGRFTIRRRLGAGGFGVVYLADDELLHREVALKLPLVQSLARPAVRERFLREAEAAAQLHHPNAVPVFEAGEEQGICYIATEYCPGPTLDRWLSDQIRPVPIEVAVALLRQLADAVQHAHDRRVLHRDLKPSNILLEPCLASPLRMTPKITDFGLAKLLDPSAGMTGSHGILGTPRYMAPEQATGNRAKIGAATDVFGLGAVLYELLTGVAPFAGKDEAETLHRLLHDSVVPPRRLRAAVPRDLEAICLKCLERRLEDRYASAQELADDLHRFSEGRPTRARPLGRIEALRRWTMRRPAVAALLAVSGAGLLSLVTLFALYSRSLEAFSEDLQAALDQRQQAQAEVEARDRRLQNLLYVSKLQLVHQAVEENDLRQASRLLTDLRSEAPNVPQGFVWRYLWNRVAAEGRQIDQQSQAIYDVQFTPTGDRMAAGGANGVLTLYDAVSFKRLRRIVTEQEEINSIAFSPDGRLLATTGDDGTIRLWDARTGEPRRTIQAYEAFAYQAIFTSDGANLISCGRDPAIRVWNVSTGALQGTLEGHTAAVESIDLAPDGTHLASASSDRTARIWELPTGKTVHVLKGHTGRVVDVVYAPRGDRLLTGSIDGTIRLWRAGDGASLQTERHVDSITAVAFLDEGPHEAHVPPMLAADRGGSVHLWPQTNADADAPLQSWKAHEGRAWVVRPAPSQAGVISAGADGKIFLWEQPPAAEERIEPRASSQMIHDVAFDCQGERLHLIRSDHVVETWNLRRGEREFEVALGDQTSGTPVAVEPLGGKPLVITIGNETVDAHELPSLRPVFQLATPWEGGLLEETSDVVCSHDLRRLAVCFYARDTTLVYDTASRELLGSLRTRDAQAVAISPTGSLVAMSDRDDVAIWDIDHNRRTATLCGHTSSVVSLSFSSNGQWLASGSRDRQVRIWDLVGDAPPKLLEGHRAAVKTLAFSPNGRLLASGDEDGEVKLWFIAESQELMSVEEPESVRLLSFSPNGDRLALQSDGRIRIWNATRNRFGGENGE